MDYESYMRRALALAAEAAAAGEVPVGCVIVDASGAVLLGFPLYLFKPCKRLAGDRIPQRDHISIVRGIVFAVRRGNGGGCHIDRRFHCHQGQQEKGCSIDVQAAFPEHPEDQGVEGHEDHRGVVDDKMEIFVFHEFLAEYDEAEAQQEGKLQVPPGISLPQENCPAAEIQDEENVDEALACRYKMEITRPS